MHKLKLSLILITILLGLTNAKAHELGSFPAEYPTGGLFIEQCDSAFYAHLKSLTGDGESWLNLDVLMSMEYAPGVWHGYDSDTPFGVSYPEVLDGWHIDLYTPCGVMISQVWENTDGTILIFVYRTLVMLDYYSQPCKAGDGSLYCGYHDFTFAYLTSEEWERISSAILE